MVRRPGGAQPRACSPRHGGVWCRADELARAWREAAQWTGVDCRPESVSMRRGKAKRRLASHRLVQTSPQRQQMDGRGQDRLRRAPGDDHGDGQNSGKCTLPKVQLCQICPTNEKPQAIFPDHSLIKLQTNTKKIMSKPGTAEVQVLEVWT